ncbi:LamG-like jellyroll fold domain-containing protein [Parapedobacter tibetensis]|uniref:LamG-like jellyroll fold domain-containing protein n=1 Tax=Parapedobacter tibetensis TaxID=2972951 RepID=UPI00214D315C|nr:LamG-like jellyroll fold domain-containing protein [Parapedobacter tibetensis]
MKRLTNALIGALFVACVLLTLGVPLRSTGQTLAFPSAEGFGRHAAGARGHASPQVYIVTNLNDSGPGSFRDAVSQPGRFVVFAVGGIIHLQSRLVVAPYTTIAGQTAPGDGIMLYGRNVSFSGASNTIARYLRIRMGANAGAGSSEDASGVANGSNIIFDHMSFSWGLDEVFSINWDNKGTDPDNITIQNSIIGQGLHRHNHSAGGLMEPGGKVSILKSLYISNKTRNPKVKGTNEFVNNVVYNFGNDGNPHGHTISGDAYIMGGSASVSEVNIINNYFISGPHTPSKTTPFSRGTPTFSLYAAGNYFDTNKNGQLDGSLVPENEAGYPGIPEGNFMGQPYAYPTASAAMNAIEAFDWVAEHVGANYPRRDPVDNLLIGDLLSKGASAHYAYRENDLPLANGGLGEVYGAPAPMDSDGDGIPDDWEDAHDLDKDNPADALEESTMEAGYLNIEVYINSLVDSPAPDFLKPPIAVVLEAVSEEEPPRSIVTLQWDDNDHEAGTVVIERREAEGDYEQVAEVAVGEETYEDDDGLTPNTTYHYRLKIIKEGMESSYGQASITTPPIPTAPEKPQQPHPTDDYQYVTVDQTGSASLAWQGSENTATYLVFLGESAESLTQLAEIEQGATPSYAAQGLEPGKTYFWRVDARNDKGTTAGDTWTFRTENVFEQGLAGYWAFNEEDGDRTIVDSTTYENHGVLGFDDDAQGVRVDGKKDRAIDLVNVDAAMYPINIPHEDHLYLGQSSFSIAFWMKGDGTHLPQDNSWSAYLLCKGSITRNGNTGATGKRFNIEFKNKQIRFAIDDDNDANGGGKDELQLDGTPFFTNEWVHVVAIRDAESKQLKIYRNGAAVGQATIQRALAGIGEASDLIIGNIGELEFLSGQNTPAPYRGQLDDLKLFNYVLSDAEIMAEYAGDSTLPDSDGPTPEMVAHYKLDETSGTMVYDASDHANHGMLRDFGADPWIADGQHGGAIKFDATTPTGAIVVPAASQNAFDANSFTISLWMRAAENTYTPSAQNAYLIQKGTFGGVGKWYGIQLNHSNRLVFAVDDNIVKSDIYADVADIDLYSGEWKHVVAVRDRDAQKLLLYVDGQLVKEGNDGTVEGIAQADLDLLIGNSAEERPYRDDLDEVRLYNYALTPEEIVALFENKEEPGLVAHYRLDETSGTAVYDTSPYGNHGVLQDFGSDPWVSDGQRGGAIKFDATTPTGAIVVPAASQNAFDENSFTISLWMRATENTYTPSAQNAYLIQKGTFGGVGKWYGIQLNHSNRLVFAVDDNIVKSDIYADVADIDLYSGEWKHVVAVRDRDAQKLLLYVDGQLAKEGNDGTIGGIAQADLDLLIGNSAESRPYRDYLDDVQLYNYALTPEEVAALFSPPIVESDLVAHYRLDEGLGLVTDDATAYANHGDLDNIGATPWITEGKYAGALDFKDNTERGGWRVPAAQQLTFDNSSFTLSFWVQGTSANLPQDNNSSAYLLCKGSIGRNESTGATGKRYNIELKNKQLRFAIDDDNDANGGGKDEIQVDGVPFFSGEWVHVVAIRDAENKRLKIYRDGELVNEQSITKALSGIGEGTDLIIGNVGALELSNLERGTAPYTGRFDDLKVYARVLNDDEVKRIFEGKPIVKAVTYISPADGTIDFPVAGATFVWEGVATAYTLHLGTDENDLVTIAEGITGESYTVPEPLEFGATYFWRVDALLDGDMVTGETWSFVTEAKSIPVIHNDVVHEVNEFSPAHTVIAQLTADNPEGETLFDWRVTENVDVNGNGADAFKLDAETGELAISDSADFVFEEGRILELKVRVSNGAGESDEQTIQVLVNFVNRLPSFDVVAPVEHCYSPEERVIQISGINPGREMDQTVELSVNANPSRMFHSLSITQPEDGVAYLHYTPKAGIHDQITVSIIAKDNGGTANGGQDTYSQTFTLEVSANPDISILADKDRVEKGEEVRLTVRNNARGNFAMTWHFDDQVIGATDILTVHPQVTTTYVVKATNPLGCEDETSITITVFEPEELAVTNVVTPNGDGINDTWMVKNIELYAGNDVKVFDISGRVLYQTKNYQNDWNGTYQGKPLAEGTYYYIITFDSGRETQRGYINIVRENR